MCATINKPVIFLAFANDRDDTVNYLRNLPDEARRLREILERAEAAGLCEVVVRSNSTARDIFKVFQDSKYRNRIAIFHYGGHANGCQLLLESSEGQSTAANAGGLAAFLAQQQGLQLVFLNGCSTRQQSNGLLDANVSAVISTSRAIDDAVATDFACQFYQGLAGRATIRTAYNEAEAAAQTAQNGDLRSLYFGSADQAEEQLAPDRWPWNLYVREGSENAALWNLPDATNDPLFGLPPLPPQDLPETPYRHLDSFTCRDAEVFFGRGRQIRDLYERLTDPRVTPIILLYGQSGVGKSSILDAGLIPRLSRDHEVRYLRRTAQGLLDTLRSAFLPQASDAPVESAWRVTEEQTGKPLILFLDQVEECYTRPLAEMPDELDQLLGVMKATFVETDRRPQGKLVLGFRKEWLAELEDQLSRYELPRNNVLLKSLDRRGIIEVVQGPARSERLVKQYGLTIEDGLAQIIADDLLADPDSAIAPTLQILLTKLWTNAKERDDAHPRFSHDLYQELKRDGILLRDFLNQQIAAFRKRYAEAVESGLLLDVLARHTTPLGTANQCTVEQLREQYAHVGGTLAALLQQCQDLHLLTVPIGKQKASTGTTRLAHDALAPLIRERFEHSDKPGQRARRVLDNRRVDWQDDQEGTPLDESDLALVEVGLGGTRSWDKIERKLVDASRELRQRRKRMRTLLRVVGILGIMLIFGLTAWALRSDARQREEQRLTNARITIESYGKVQRVKESPVRESEVVFDSLPSSGDIGPLVQALDALDMKNLRFDELERMHQVSDELLTELARLSGIRRLNLKGQKKLSDFRPLATLTNLMELNLSGTQINEMPDIADLPNLEKLYLNETLQLEKIDVANHKKLRELHIYECAAKQIELTDLCQLTLLNAGLTQSLSKFDLSGLCDLVELTVTETKLRRIELNGFPYLKNVYVHNNPKLSFLAVKSCEKCELIVVSKNHGLETIQLLGVRDDLDIECDRKEIHVETDSKTLKAMLARREIDVNVVEPEAIDGALRECVGSGSSEVRAAP